MLNARVLLTIIVAILAALPALLSTPAPALAGSHTETVTLQVEGMS